MQFIGDWGLGIGQSPIPNPQSPIPNPQSPITDKKKYYITHTINYSNFYFLKNYFEMIIYKIFHLYDKI